MIKTNTIFSHGTLQLTAELEDIYSDLSIVSVELYEFDKNNDGNGDPYVLIEDGYELIWHDENHTGFKLMCRFTDKTDRLVKWVVRVDPEFETQSGHSRYELPCCAEEDEHHNFKFEGYAVDLTQYERAILDAINIRCNDCEVPKDLLNGLLKLFAVKAAVQAKSPYMEMIFAKIACNGLKYHNLVHSSSRNCNCNG